MRIEAHKMKDSEAKTRWSKENMVLLGLKLHKTKDADIIDYLSAKESQAEKITKQTIIKIALREYMEKHENG